MKKVFLVTAILLMYSGSYAGSRPSIDWSIAFNPGVTGDAIRGVSFSKSEPDVVYIAGDASRVVKPTIGPVSDMVPIYPFTRLIPGDIDARSLFLGSGLFIAKMNYRTNEILFFTHIVFGIGGMPDISDLAIGDDGSIYLVGSVGHYIDQGGYFPLVNSMDGCVRTNSGGYGYDGVFIKLNSDASEILSSCFFGGSGDDYINAVEAMPDGKYVIVGRTESANLFTRNAFQSRLNGTRDGFFAVFNADGSAVTSSYFGGTEQESISEVAIGPTGRVLMVGATVSDNVYVSPDAYQSVSQGAVEAILLEVDALTGNVVYSSYFGGTSNDSFLDVATDGVGNVYLVGTSNSVDYPTAGSGSESPIAEVGVVVTKFNPSMSQILFSTFRAATETQFESGEAISVNSQGDIVVVGQVGEAYGYIMKDGLVELDDPGFEQTFDEDGHVIKWLNRGDRYELDYASLFGGRGQGFAVELQGRDKVLIGGWVFGNSYLDTTYHYESVPSDPGNSYGAFAMLIQNEVTANASTGNSGKSGGGSMSLLVLALLAQVMARQVLKGSNRFFSFHDQGD